MERPCRRCLADKPAVEFFDDDRAPWCKQCNLDFLVAHGDDEAYDDAREFVAPHLRNRPWTAAQAIRELRREIGVPGADEREGFAPRSKLRGARDVFAVRVPGARAVECSQCGERFGGMTGYRRHRPVRLNTCRGGSEIGLTQDPSGVWRYPPPASIPA